MKPYIAALLFAFGLTTGPATARDLWTTLNDTAPRSVFDQIQETAPRSLFVEIADTAPLAPVFETLGTHAP